VGASNALDAFRLYAGKVPPLAMNVLTYMALVAMDKDREPKYWKGHETLAVHCLGRDEASIDDSDLRAVRRAITSLFKAGAITVAQHSSGRGEKGGRVFYRLHLVTPTQDEKRPVDDAPPTDLAPDGKCPVDTGSTGRKVVEHRTKSDRAPDGKRPAKEYEETEELGEKQEYSFLSSDPVPVRARKVPDESDELTRVHVTLPRPAPGGTTTSALLSAECPFCGAEPGRQCLNSGTGKATSPHEARIKAAEAA
jgi:hypothetical protein